MALGHSALPPEFPPALLQRGATVTVFGRTDRSMTGESFRTEGESVAFLSQSQNSQETAASAAAAVTELKMKVRRHNSHCYTTTFSVSQPLESRFKPRTQSSASVFINSVKTKKRMCDFLLGCQFFARTVQLHNNNVRDCFPPGSSCYWSQNIATSNQRQLPAPLPILGKIY